MGGKKTRKHYKVSKLPDNLVEAVNKKLVEGYTYQDIAEYLTELGHKIGKSSVQRYGKDFMSRLERLRVVKEQAKSIVDSNPDAPATEMAEAANQLSMQLIMEFLMKVDITDLEEAKVTEIFKVLAKLESSGVSREKLKFTFNKGVEAAANKIKEALRSEVTSDPDLVAKLYTMVDQKAKEVSQ
ncbi:MAG: DUF3486 family protein [Firmicutes bacterium]|nr:DUF3486 family protein [Bacillota bacterium]